ncbi:MAG: septal ring lytic transglycosylase RlpA family protein [Bacteroidetes bacterium]|nr:septal ring lytic transglycosylase RlpA family protein [Bacteroidota bacterium]
MLRFTTLCICLLCGLTALQGQSYTEKGYAVFYADYFEGRKTANGEIFSNDLFTCAHASHPHGTLLKVTRPENGKSVTVRVNDRGGFGEDIVVDMTKAAAAQLGFISDGKAWVVVEVVGYNGDPETSATAKGAPTAESENTYKFKSGGPAEEPKGRVDYLPLNQKGIFLQLASYTIKSNAERQYLAWREKGMSYLYMQESGTGEAKKYSILMGPFTSRAVAEQQLKNIKSKFYMDGFIRELR